MKNKSWPYLRHKRLSAFFHVLLDNWHKTFGLPSEKPYFMCHGTPPYYEVLSIATNSLVASNEYVFRTILKWWNTTLKIFKTLNSKLEKASLHTELRFYSRVRLGLIGTVLVIFCFVKNQTGSLDVQQIITIRYV